jgi:outer membrane protein TolC
MINGNDMKKRFLGSLALLICMTAAAVPVRGEEVLTWEECVAYALANNPDLRSSQELIRQTRANVGIARSGYLPQISASLGLDAVRQDSESDLQRLKLSKMRSTSQIQSAITNDLLNGRTTSRTDSVSYGVKGKQLVFDSMKTIYDIKSASSQMDEARYAHAVTSSRLRLNLRVAFVGLLKAQEQIQISKEIAERWKKNLDLVRMRYRAGREHRGSLLNAEANLASARQTLTQAERDLAVAQRSLLTQMGVSSLRPVRADGKLLNKKDEEKKPDFDAIAAAHPAVLQAKSLEKSARYSENARIASFFPVISVTAGADKSKSYADGATSVNKLNSVNLSAGIEFTMPIFTGGSNYYNLDKARSQARKARADEISAREQVVLILEQYWSNWRNAIDRVEVQRKFLEAAVERARISEAEYSLGLVIFDNWIIIEDQLSQMKMSYLDALADQSITEAQWIQAKGETLSYDN